MVVPDDVPADGKEKAGAVPAIKSTTKATSDPSATRTGNSRDRVARPLLDTGRTSLLERLKDTRDVQQASDTSPPDTITHSSNAASPGLTRIRIPDPSGARGGLLAHPLAILRGQAGTRVCGRRSKLRSASSLARHGLSRRTGARQARNNRGFQPRRRRRNVCVIDGKEPESASRTAQAALISSIDRSSTGSSRVRSRVLGDSRIA